MSLELHLMRHAKSDWSAGGDDHERPLNGRGRKAARLMGRFLASVDPGLGLVLCSSAVRARETVELALEAGALDLPVEIDRGLYLPPSADMLARLRKVDDGIRSVLLVSHEPSSSALVSVLTGGAPPRFPTAAIARIALGCASWSELAQEAGRLEWLVTPRLLQAAGD